MGKEYDLFLCSVLLHLLKFVGSQTMGIDNIWACHDPLLLGSYKLKNMETMSLQPGIILMETKRTPEGKGCAWGLQRINSRIGIFPGVDSSTNVQMPSCCSSHSTHLLYSFYIPEGPVFEGSSQGVDMSAQLGHCPPVCHRSIWQSPWVFFGIAEFGQARSEV